MPPHRFARPAESEVAIHQCRGASAARRETTSAGTCSRSSFERDRSCRSGCFALEQRLELSESPLKRRATFHRTPKRALRLPRQVLTHVAHEVDSPLSSPLDIISQISTMHATAKHALMSPHHPSGTRTYAEAVMEGRKAEARRTVGKVSGRCRADLERHP